MKTWMDAGVSFVATYYSAAVIQVVLHRLFGHTKRLMPVYSGHTHGHHASYARNRLLQDAWVPTERHVMGYFIIPFVVLGAVVYFACSLAVFFAHLAAVAFAFWWNITLHRHYHLSGSWLARFAWFRTKRALHFVHHRRVRSNYAITEYLLDRLMGTYRAPEADSSLRRGTPRSPLSRAGRTAADPMRR